MANNKITIGNVEQEGIVAASGDFPTPGFAKVIRLEGRRYWQGL